MLSTEGPTDLRHNQGSTVKCGALAAHLTAAQGQCHAEMFAEELRDVYRELDRNGEGAISAEDFQLIMSHLGCSTNLAKIAQDVGAADLDADRRVNFEEFQHMMEQSMSATITQTQLKKFFQTFDEDCSGYITTAELRHVMTKLGHQLSDDVMDALMTFLDRDGTGQCCFEDFLKMFVSFGIKVEAECNEASTVMASESEAKSVEIAWHPTEESGKAARALVPFSRHDNAEMFALMQPVMTSDGFIDTAALQEAMELLSLNRQISRPSLPDKECAKIDGTHWNPQYVRRGLGPMLRKVDHIAIIVSDVGRSAAFYSDVIGFQQVRRPDFDRHGAWFTMGNIELHLIKGQPIVADGSNLIVGHISLQVSDIDKVPELLRAQGVSFEQNVSVPKGVQAAGVGTNETADGSVAVKQYFVRDPDGYYVEICNCDQLEEYCLGEKQALPGFRADIEPLDLKEMCLTKLIGNRLAREGHVRIARIRDLGARLQGRTLAEIAAELGAVPTSFADPELVKSFLVRRTVFGDICQCMSEDEVSDVLCLAGNSAEIAIEMLTIRAGNSPQLQPPAYFLDNGEKFKPKPFSITAGDSKCKTRSSGLVSTKSMKSVSVLDSPTMEKPAPNSSGKSEIVGGMSGLDQVSGPAKCNSQAARPSAASLLAASKSSSCKRMQEASESKIPRPEPKKKAQGKWRRCSCGNWFSGIVEPGAAGATCPRCQAMVP